ncbi:MAG: hypothetical protein ACE5ER_04300 [Nitrospinaceae bacterium]
MFSKNLILETILIALVVLFYAAGANAAPVDPGAGVPSGAPALMQTAQAALADEADDLFLGTLIKTLQDPKAIANKASAAKRGPFIRQSPGHNVPDTIIIDMQKEIRRDSATGDQRPTELAQESGDARTAGLSLFQGFAATKPDNEALLLQPLEGESQETIIVHLFKNIRQAFVPPERDIRKFPRDAASVRHKIEVLGGRGEMDLITKERDLFFGTFLTEGAAAVESEDVATLDSGSRLTFSPTVVRQGTTSVTVDLQNVTVGPFGTVQSGIVLQFQ